MIACKIARNFFFQKKCRERLLVGYAAPLAVIKKKDFSNLSCNILLHKYYTSLSFIEKANWGVD